VLYNGVRELTSPDSWPYQSNGNCTNHCKEEGKYAFAVIQYNDCHCSNYIPADQEDISKCQKDCPGYPPEKCGNKDDGLYIYIEMDGKPSGTLGGSSSTAAATSAPAATSQAPSSQAPQAPQAPTVSDPSFFLFLVISSLYSVVWTCSSSGRAFVL
jgi:cell wall integrity and stress response component